MAVYPYELRIWVCFDPLPPFIRRRRQIVGLCKSPEALRAERSCQGSKNPKHSTDMQIRGNITKPYGYREVAELWYQHRTTSPQRLYLSALPPLRPRFPITPLIHPIIASLIVPKPPRHRILPRPASLPLLLLNNILILLSLI